MGYKQLKKKLASFKVILCIMALIASIAGCDDRFETIQPPGVTTPKQAIAETRAPVINMDLTKSLFTLITKKELGDQVGLVEMRSEGILIHPGETHPTIVSFNLLRTYHKISIRPFIASLPAEATKIKEAGTVGLEFLLDANSQGRIVIDRNTTLIKEFNLTNIDTLTVIVDNDDGRPWFDWLILGVVVAQ